MIDTSALMAVLLREKERERVLATIANVQAAVPATAVVELGIQLDKFTAEERQAAERAIELLDLPILPITPSNAALAREAHRRYGRYSGSPARLNFGDCFSYALAKERDEPLLFKGDDFVHTDVRVAELA